MSVLTKPDGDAVAKSFGKYMSLNELKSIKVGNKVDILCDSSVHYVAKVTRIDDALDGRLKWVACGVSQEYFGSFRSIYISTEGKYSSTAHNTQLIEDARVAKNKKESGRSKYIEGTKYDADFLARPYRENERKRKVLDPSEMMMLPDRTRTKRVSLPGNVADSGSNIRSNSKEGDAAVGVSSTVAQRLPNLSRLVGSANTGAPATNPSLTSATVATISTASAATLAAFITNNSVALSRENVISNLGSVIPVTTATKSATASATTSATSATSTTVNARNAKNPTMASSDPSADLPALPPWLPPPTTKYTSACTSYPDGAVPGPRINMLHPLYTLDYTTGEISINYENIPHRVKSATLVEGSKDAYRVRVVDESSDSDSEYDVKDASNPRVRPTRSNNAVKGKDVKRSIHCDNHSTNSTNASEDCTVSRPTHVRDMHTQSDKLYNTSYAQYYAHDLLNSTNNRYRDCGALHFLNNKIYTLYATKRLKGIVFGPLCMYIQAHDQYLAQTIQHAIPENILLTFVVCHADDLETLSSLFNQLRVRVNIVFPEIKLNIHRDIHRWCIFRYMYTSPTILNILVGLVPELHSVLFHPERHEQHNWVKNPYEVSFSIKKPRIYSVTEGSGGCVLLMHENLHRMGVWMDHNGDKFHDGACMEGSVVPIIDNDAKLVFSNMERRQRLQEFTAGTSSMYGNGGVSGGSCSGCGSGSSGSSGRSGRSDASGGDASGGGGGGGGAGGSRGKSGSVATVVTGIADNMAQGGGSTAPAVKTVAGASSSNSSSSNSKMGSTDMYAVDRKRAISNFLNSNATVTTDDPIVGKRGVNMANAAGDVVRDSLPACDVVDLCDSDSDRSDGDCLFLDASNIPTVARLVHQTARPTTTAASPSAGATLSTPPKLYTNSTSLNVTSSKPLMSTKFTNTTHLTNAHASTITYHSASVDASSQTILCSTSDACSSTDNSTTTTGTNTVVASTLISSTNTTMNSATSTGTAMSTPDPVSNPACSSDAIQSVIATLTAFSNVSDEELIARNVDPIAVRALLLAQTKLACALHEMLK